MSSQERILRHTVSCLSKRLGFTCYFITYFSRPSRKQYLFSPYRYLFCLLPFVYVKLSISRDFEMNDKIWYRAQYHDMLMIYVSLVPISCSAFCMPYRIYFMWRIISSIARFSSLNYVIIHRVCLIRYYARWDITFTQYLSLCERVLYSAETKIVDCFRFHWPLAQYINIFWARD